jgi:hypothetical protein
MTKAYDNIPISKLWEVLGESNIYNSLSKALQNLYGNTAQVKIGNRYNRTSRNDTVRKVDEDCIWQISLEATRNVGRC